MQDTRAAKAEQKKDRVVSLYISYWSLRDPLCQTQSVAYLRELTKLGHRFALITFEQPKYALGFEDAAAMKRELAAQGIIWYPLQYHQKFSLLATAFDCLSGVMTGLRVAFRHRARIVHSRASIPAAMALVISRLCGIKFLYDADSLLSEEYADVGHWRREGVPFRLTAQAEGLARQFADSIIVLSERLRRDYLDEFKAHAPITVIPCCVDVCKFRFQLKASNQLGLKGEEKLFVYVGKIGSWYLVDETFEFFRIARAKLGSGRLLIVTADAPEAFHQAAERCGVDRRDYYVTRAAHDEVTEWLSASDVGLALIRSVNSKRGSSPVKVSEYLSVGLPVVMTDGIGDYSDLIARKRLGAVLKELTTAAYLESVDALTELWSEEAALQKRCRETVEAYASLVPVGATRYQEVYQQLLSK
jgi:glycosyltransferase involved in cell wall biosynthesis